MSGQEQFSDQKQFAIDHMNRDHVLALYDYANAFAGQNLDYFEQDKNQLRLSDVSLDALHLEWNANGAKKTASVPIKPRMKSYGDLRAATSQLAATAAHKLGLSPYQVKKYQHWDNPVDFLIDLSCWFIYILAITGIKLAPYSDNILFRFLDMYAGKLAIGLAAVHSVEVYLKLMPLLRKYRVPSPAYEKWCFSTIIGGIFAIKRFERQAAKIGHKSTK